LILYRTAVTVAAKVVYWDGSERKGKGRGSSSGKIKYLAIKIVTSFYVFRWSDKCAVLDVGNRGTCKGRVETKGISSVSAK